jgi:hypothetical protein
LTPTYSLAITSAQKSVIGIAPKDSGGVTVPLDTPPTVTSDTPTVAKVTAFNGVGFMGQTWTIYGVSAGTATISISGTSGGIALTETVLVTVTPDPASTFGVTFTAPVHQ